MGVGAGLYTYVVVVQKFTFAISSPDEFLLYFLRGIVKTQRLDLICNDQLEFVWNTTSLRKTLHAGGHRHILDCIQVLLVVAYFSNDSSFTMKLTSILYETTAKYVTDVLNFLLTVLTTDVPE